MCAVSARERLADLTTLIIIIAVGLLMGLLVWWLLIETEGVYLGRRVVIWLYDVYAQRYDNIKGYQTFEEQLHLAQPLMVKIRPQTAPQVLDIATGSGRLPLALGRHAAFEGHITALDLSDKMLAQARRKINQTDFAHRVTLMLADGDTLPFADDAFDVVACLEAWEFMPHPERALAEACRVLRPGGLLLTTNRIHIRTMPGRIWTEAHMHELLAQNGMVGVTINRWQYDYDIVWAQKSHL